MSEKTSSSNVSIENIYKLDGRVPVAKAIPFGLQHVMAMFVSNLAPIAMVCGVAKLLGSDVPGISGVDLARLLQSAYVYSRSGYIDSAVSGMENRCKTAGCNGCKLYICCNFDLHCLEL